MPADVEASLIYWPALAAFGALVVGAFAFGFFVTAMKWLSRNLAATRSNSAKLKAARAEAREFEDKAEAREGQISKLHDQAGKLFWRHEKTWIG
jgi:hypothetical protein